jgi:hypothetical protein
MKSVNKSFVGTSQFWNAAVAALAVCSFTVRWCTDAVVAPADGIR